MIASIRGEVLEVALDHVVIEAAGVGYRVNATPSTLATLRRGGEARLVTAMIVREDSMTLYGFADSDSRDLFQRCCRVSGVGPRLAMATLAVLRGAGPAPGARRRRRHRADPGAGHRQAQRRTDGAGTARQGRRRLRDRGCAGRSTGTRCAVRSWKPLSALALRPSRPKRPPTGCWRAKPEATTSSALRAALSMLGKTK